MTMVLDALTGAGVILLVALGLALVLSLMDVINLAQPAFMAAGGYVAYDVHQHGLPLGAALVVGVLAAAGVGLIAENLVMRWLYKRTLDTLLVTAGLSLIATQVIILLYGRSALQLDALVHGSVDVLGTSYPAYRVFLLVVAALLIAGLALVSRYTMLGLRAQAIMENMRLAASLGINTRRMRMWTFTAGAALAGLAGILIAPLSSLSPAYGADFVVPAFLVAIIGGRSLTGLCLSALIVGGGASLLARATDPVYSMVLIVMVAVLLLRLMPARWVAAGAGG